MVSSICDVKQSARRIVCLDTMSYQNQTDGATSTEMLAIHEDGEIRCYTESLDREIWVARLAPDDDAASDASVKYGRVISVGEAQKALLKDREDILASLGGSSSLEAIRLLVLLTSTDESSTMTLRLLKVNVSTANLNSPVGRHQDHLQEILSVPIPNSSEQRVQGSQIQFHITSGTLYHYTPGVLTTYDVSGCLPNVGHRIVVEHGRMSSCLRISPSLVFMGNKDTVSIVDVRYNACQAQLNLPKHKRSRKSVEAVTDGANSGNLILLTYNASLDVIVALHEGELKAFQLATSTVQSDRLRKRKRDGLLIDSIGRGTRRAKRRLLTNGPPDSSRPVGFFPKSKYGNTLWKKQKDHMDQCLTTGDTVRLERLLSSDAETEGRHDDDPIQTSITTIGKFDSRKVEYVIGKLLDVESSRPSDAINADGISKRLKISKLVTTIPLWLFTQARFSDCQIETALKHVGLISSSDVIRTGSVAEALAGWDPSLQTLFTFLDSPAPFTAIEIVHVLRHSIAKEEKSDSIHDTKLLTNGEAQSADDVDKESLKKSDLHGCRISPTPSDGSHHSVTARILTTASIKLHGFSSREVSDALRGVLSKAEIRLLVDMLRVQLARYGWLTPYVEEGFHTTVQPRPKDNQICVVAHLLSCAVDSIGTGGWIMGSSIADDLTEIAETIAYMKAEISAALEGIEEATYLKGMLGEMLLCGKSFTKQPKAVKQRTSKEMNERTRTGIISVDDEEDHTLPLGGKLARGISEYKVGAGGELIRRSARDIGRLKNRNVPKYSFERIII